MSLNSTYNLEEYSLSTEKCLNDYTSVDFINNLGSKILESETESLYKFEFTDFQNDLLNFQEEENYLKEYSKYETTLSHYLKDQNDKARYYENVLKQKEYNLKNKKNEQFKKLQCLNFDQPQLSKISQYGNKKIIENLDLTKEKQIQAKNLENELKIVAFDCLRFHYKCIALQSKLEKLKIKTQKESEHFRLSYQFIESTSRVKVSSYDGKRLAGCILPQNSTLQYSHIFEIYLEQDLVQISDWLWEKIFTFSVPSILQNKYIKQPTIFSSL